MRWVNRARLLGPRQTLSVDVLFVLFRVDSWIGFLRLKTTIHEITRSHTAIFEDYQQAELNHKNFN